MNSKIQTPVNDKLNEAIAALEAAQQPSVPMSEIDSLVQSIALNPDYDLDLYGLDVVAAVRDALRENTPEHYNETDRQNLELALRARLEDVYEMTAQLRD